MIFRHFFRFRRWYRRVAARACLTGSQLMLMLFLSAVATSYRQLIGSGTYVKVYAPLGETITEPSYDSNNHFLGVPSNESSFPKGVLEASSSATPSTAKSGAYLSVPGVRIYLYSAIAVNSSATQAYLYQRQSLHRRKSVTWDYFVLSAWEERSLATEQLRCCYAFNNGTVASVALKDRRHFLFRGSAKLLAKQYVCPNLARHSEDFPVGVSATLAKFQCSADLAHYLEPTYPEKQTTPEIAICTKLAYGDLSAEQLLEWFEVHRQFGVKKVLAYSYNLNDAARRVFRFYQQLGLAEVFPFGLPEKEMVPREVGMKNMQSWNDEQIVAFDCQERLHGYQYVAMVDTDEYIVANKNKNWRQMLDYLSRNYPRAAGYVFMVVVHATTWGKSSNTSDLYLTQYTNRTRAMLDRVKTMYIPARVAPGSVSTHTFNPVAGFTRNIVPPLVATLHHFRSCRREWLRAREEVPWGKDQQVGHAAGDLPVLETPKNCFAFDRITDRSVAVWALGVQHSIRSIRDKLNVTNNE